MSNDEVHGYRCYFLHIMRMMANVETHQIESERVLGRGVPPRSSGYDRFSYKVLEFCGEWMVYLQRLER
jgi:hypothetical protein